MSFARRVCANPKATISELSVISASWKRNPGFRSVERGRYPQFCAARITGAERRVFRSTIRKPSPDRHFKFRCVSVYFQSKGEFHRRRIVD
ncbi:hypothetical protein CGCSCA5_v007230 [Colletotrichum siamense]|nr:hypothetical protein CGCSCA5_v007230 [Colletotrichum siamense]